uniref:Nuclear receptor interacting protein 1 n=1 Tax=Paramormyrops kingsleyae TaxID=1676925 RepID=A0A3B3S9V6_9TELE|nr:nuclear receptor-interacting protein 1 [Paramormyrops kingsleyae]XP_023692105.1 nuclear receptor-interacting protein 1 [Paramormyrops kingsleyae]XP_023692106.1 nuclear receptor-interacting protein 1 [Paramormyrops kingsleyae]
MTHGEELGSEMHQDSAVLTYLEGLLMHQVAGGATATRRLEAGHSNQQQGNKAAGSYRLPSHDSSEEQERTVPLGGATHLKKARLLCSEPRSEPRGHRSTVPVLDLNGQGSNTRADALDGSPKCKGESTLLASLLQSFSNRLQNVVLSQQIVQSLKQQECERVNRNTQEQRTEEEEAVPASPQCYGVASSRLKGLMKKNKMQNHNSVPYRRRTSQERLSESPQVPQGGTQPAASDPISCAARLKAVANLVNIRSSPATSPKPNMACSQLALLLSSEAHLQQYSRDHALKAQLSGRSASQRLAAMATQQTQDKKQADAGQAQMGPDMVSSLRAKNGAQPQPTIGPGKRSPTLTPGRSKAAPSPMHPFKDRRPFDRHVHRPAQNCSSLLLQLLNNHNTQSQVNGQGHLREDYSMFPGHCSPLLSDSEYSNAENSLPKDSSDAESSSSSCSPIDLSVRSKDTGPALGPSSSSLDKLTESLINTWKPEPPRPKLAEPRELESNVAVKPHHKVTLLQLLLDHKKNDKSPLNSDMRSVSPKTNNSAASKLTPIARCEETRTQSPQGGLTGRNFQELPTFCHGRDSSGSVSPYNLYTSPHSQSIPLDLCKSKSFTREGGSHEPAFSASKLLQNLAQCGLQKSVSSPPLRAPVPPSKMQARELNLDKPVTLLERLNTPVLRNKTPVSEAPLADYAKAPLISKPSPPVSEVENLLERRTVLQLLLGTASSKESQSGHRDRPAVRIDHVEKQANKSESCCSSNGLLLDFKIKSELGGEGGRSDSDEAAERCNNKEREYDGRSPPSILNLDVKPEPFSPDAVHRDGLLSQLLKQHTRAYQATVPTDLHVIGMKEEQQEHRGTAVPKKRRFFPEVHDRLNGMPCTDLSRGETPKESTDQHPGAPRGRKVRKMVSLSRPDTPVRRPISESPPRDSGGFNVLKQLLLSDNCLKDLSQSRSATSPLQANCKANGSSPNECGPNRELAGSRVNASPQGLGAVEFSSTATLTASDRSSGSPWGNHTVRQDSLRSNLLPLRRDSEGPIQWAAGGDERRDSRPDSPRLTKTNPILYYMLQKGNTQLGQGRKELCTVSTPCRMQVKVKEEPLADIEVNDHGVSLKCQSQLRNESHDSNPECLNGSPKKV